MIDLDKQTMENYFNNEVLGQFNITQYNEIQDLILTTLETYDKLNSAKLTTINPKSEYSKILTELIFTKLNKKETI